jgi:preprotein translocase subunit YajC
MFIAFFLLFIIFYMIGYVSGVSSQNKRNREIIQQMNKELEKVNLLIKSNIFN